MHGRARVSVRAEREREADERDAAAGRKKIALYSRLQSNVLQFHREKRYTEDALQQSGKLLELNPDVYTAWNFRKSAFRHLITEAGDDEVARKKLADEELRLAEKALKKNPKSYGAWHHRKWIAAQGLAPMKREFELLAMLLGLDNRNFHGWDYRRFAVQTSGQGPEAELQYSMEKINEDPRNYSAWHVRSQLLMAIHRAKERKEGAEAALDPIVVKEEYELVRQALWTAPDDQSGFMYYQWLLGHTVPEVKPSLIATWPSEGICVDAQDGRLHTVLLFSERVMGVGDDTAALIVEGVQDTVEREGRSDCAATVNSWRPLECGEGSRSWVRVVEVGADKASDAGFNSENGYAVSLKVGCCPGVISLSGVPLQGSTQVQFSVLTRRSDKESTLAALLTSKTETEEKTSERAGSGGELPPDAKASFSIGVCGNESVKTGDSIATWRHVLLEEEVGMCRELLEEETESVKWPKLTLARLLHSLSTCNGHYDEIEVIELYQQLAKDDPGHAEYYKDVQSRQRLHQVLASSSSLAKHWWSHARLQLGDVDKRAVENQLFSHGQIRLSHMDLGYFEGAHRLLWVRQLDLSHNRLRSAHGLESLQQLISLNLSHNCITHGSAVSPLGMLPHMQALDLSYNLLGSVVHNNQRYSSPSTMGDWPLVTATGKDYQENVYEVFRGFQGLGVQILDLRGNKVVEELSYTTIIKALLPSVHILHQ